MEAKVPLNSMHHTSVDSVKPLLLETYQIVGDAVRGRDRDRAREPGSQGVRYVALMATFHTLQRQSSRI
jgi:hypothetical protein